MTDLEKKNYYNILFGYYGVLLTEKQQALFEEYYGEDFSLSEIASEYNISRNAVHDTIKKVQASLDEFEEKLVEFIETIINKMGYKATVDIMFREEHKIGLKLNSSYSSILIGRKGKNLDALQLLANVYAGKLGRADDRIILDTENYRIRREESLVRLAYTTADKVRMHRNSILLEPMNPFERRLIHTTLNDISDVETKSEGDGLYKQVRVIYKGIL